MLDFTLKTSIALLEDLKKQGFSFLTLIEFISNRSSNVVTLRHDVDLLPRNSLQFARIQAERGIKGTYYFRIVPESFDEKIIKEIYSIGHEIGYHYEDFVFASQKSKSNSIADLQDRKTARLQDSGRLEKELADIAIESFSKNLKKLRDIAPVKTICMHGSPMSRWDNRLLWKYYDYHDFGIIGEPYFDVNFNEVLYITDTGRRWDGEFVSVWDKAQGTGHRAQGIDPFKDWKVKPLEINSLAPRSSDCKPFPKFHSTFNIIHAAKEGRLPDKIIMTFHPQRWTNKPLPWVRELVWQNVKNVGKYFLVIVRS